MTLNFSKKEVEGLIEAYYLERENKEVLAEVSLGIVRGQETYREPAYVLSFNVKEKVIDTQDGKASYLSSAIGDGEVESILADRLAGRELDVQSVEYDIKPVNGVYDFVGLRADCVEKSMDEEKHI